MKHNKPVYLIALVALMFASCKSCSNKAGHKVGETIGEFSEGVGKGAEGAFEITVEPSIALKAKGIAIGKVLLSNDTTTANHGSDNKLSVYMIFENAFEGDMTVKVSDAKGKEMGRSKQPVKADKGTAGYYDFVFDKRTNIDSDSKIAIE